MIADAFSLDCSLVCQKTEAMVRREDRRDMREARRRTVGTGKEKTAAQKRAIREARRRIKKGRTVWSKEELETLRTYYPLEGRACAKRFPGRKPATIAAMAHSRGYICEKNQNRWKKEEEDILLQYWKTDPERVMRETGRTRHACENKAMHCGLNHKDEEIQPCVRSARTPWTYKELDILREYYHMETAAKVAQRIPGRSIHSIRSKAESMGLVPNHKWTREELGILKTYGLDDMDRLVMMLPAHKKYSIQRKAEQLGIA